MILLGLTLCALACFGVASHLLDDGPDQAPTGESHALDALLFLLCLVGILSHASKKPDDEF